MATKIVLKYGQGVPTDTDISGPGEIAIDILNKVIYTKDAGDNVVMLGADVSSEIIDWSQLDNVPTEFKPEDHTHTYVEVDDGSGKTLDVEIADILAHLSTIDSELGSLAGNLTFAGTVQMATGVITSVTAAGTDVGFTTGPIPVDPPVGSVNLYFVCENGGSFDGGTYNGGDWLVSEGNGNGWAGIHFDSTINVLWDDIGSKPTEFKPEPHTHIISDITSLQDELDDKTDVGHNHVIADITGLQAELDAKASITTINGGTY